MTKKQKPVTLTINDDYRKSYTHERPAPANAAPTSRPEARQENANGNPATNSQQGNTNHASSNE
ncbi:MAG: hypothetical protein JRJ49_02915 [Deltaproteobacteria bacterium]|nr:hypothetical protein [Deltaproteobacteria bacterium]